MTQTLQSGASPAAGCRIKVAPVVCRAGPVALAPCELQGVGADAGVSEVPPMVTPNFTVCVDLSYFLGQGSQGPF